MIASAFVTTLALAGFVFGMPANGVSSTSRGVDAPESPLVIEDLTPYQPHASSIPRLITALPQDRHWVVTQARNGTILSIRAQDISAQEAAQRQIDALHAREAPSPTSTSGGLVPRDLLPPPATPSYTHLADGSVGCTQDTIDETEMYRAITALGTWCDGAYGVPGESGKEWINDIDGDMGDVAGCCNASLNQQYCTTREVWGAWLALSHFCHSYDQTGWWYKHEWLKGYGFELKEHTPDQSSDVCWNMHW